MPTSSPASFRRFVLIAATAWPAAAFAQSEPKVSAPGSAPVLTLDQMIVSAARAPQDPRYVASAVSLVSLTDLADEQVTSLKDALAQQPGVILSSTGAAGSQGTVFLRGANSHQTLFVVDGVRMSDRSASFQNFLGGADLAGLERIEVLRGPQSTLYGSSAMGGVIRIDTTRGAGAHTGRVAVTAGSFDTHGAEATATGAEGAFGYSMALGYNETANDRPQNAYRNRSGSTRLEYAVAPGALVGVTFRGQKSDYEEPGSRLFPSTGTVDFGNYLTTVYGEARPADGFTSRLTLGSFKRDYTFTSSWGVSPVENERRMLDWQNNWEISSRAQVVAGVNYEKSRNIVDGAATRDRLAAGYVSAIVRVRDDLTLTAGGRYDDYRSAGAAATGRAGVAWRPGAGTKLRATYGTGFSAPGSDDVFGVPSYGQLPSPALQPEKSRGWDVGVDQEIAGGAGTIGLTYFHNRFRNLFDYEIVDFTTFEGRTVNRARASTEGAEVAAVARLGQRVKVRAGYTYLEARNDDTAARLTRRPRHTGDAEMQLQAGAAWLLGAGMHVVADRVDSGAPFEDYTCARLFASYGGARGWRASVQVENALDESYEEAPGYPALPLAVYGRVEWRF